MARPAVFLDRDGVLNQEVGYIHRLEDLQLIPGAAQAVRRLNDAGWFCCLASNQSGPARDYYSIDHVHALHQRLQELLAASASAVLDAVLFLPDLSRLKGELWLTTQAGQHGVNPIQVCW